MLDIKKIPELIEKLGDGVYTIKIKKGKITIFTKSDRFEGKQILEILKKDEN